MNIFIKIVFVFIFVFNCSYSNNDKIKSFQFILSYINAFKENSNSTKENKSINNHLTGVAQKGPFVKGSLVTITELNEDLTKTSTVYQTKTKDDLGHFEIDREFSKRYILISTTGNYFDEVKNQVTTEPITLNSIVDIAENKIINVNLLTNFQTKRLESLVQKGEKFETAKSKSKREILQIFDIDESKIEKPLHLLNIQESNELFRVSVIVQGANNTSNLKSLLTKLEKDFKSNGSITNELTAKLREQEEEFKKNVGYDKVKNNLEKKFNIKTKINPEEISKKEIRLYKRISIGRQYSLALDKEGYLYAWGANDHGRLGDGTKTDRLIPTKIGNRKYKTVSAGFAQHALALDEEGYLYAWGRNNRGQLGDGTKTDRLIPTKIGNRKYKAISAGGYNLSLALDEEGYLYAWGFNDQGNLGDGTTIDRLIPTKIGNRKYKMITLEKYVSYAIDTEGYLWTWGSSYYSVKNQPTKVGTRKYKSVSIFDSHSAAIGEDGYIYIWYIANTNTWSPQKKTFGSDRKYKSIASGYGFFLALGEDDYIYSWGSNYTGVLGLGTYQPEIKKPTKVGNRKYKYMSASYEHSLAVDKQGNIWTWGDNREGILGNGYKSKLDTLTKLGDKKYKNISAGFYNSFAIDKNDNLWAWGRNDYGQLGDSTTIDRIVPTQIGNTKYKAVSAGTYNSFAIDENDNLWAWGRNAYGHLGDGTKIDRLVPTQIGNTKYTAVSAGSHNSLAIDENDNLWAWGRNDYGQLGNGTTTVHIVPTQIGDRKYKSITTYDDRSLAIDEDGLLYSWGKDESRKIDTRKTYLGVALDHPNVRKKDNEIRYITVPTQLGTRKYKQASISISSSMALGEDDFLYVWGFDILGGKFITPQKSGNTQFISISNRKSLHGRKETTLMIDTNDSIWRWFSWKDLNFDNAAKEKISGNRSYIKINQGGKHSLALDKDGYLWVSGSNDEHQLGLGLPNGGSPVKIELPKDE